MTQVITKPRYAVRLARTSADVRAAQALRHLAFRASKAGGAGSGRLDRDKFDADCAHILVETQGDDTQGDGHLVCCFRILHLQDGTEVPRSYSAQFYDLSALARFDQPMVEMGRFCMHPDRHDPDILRVAWGALTRYVDAHRIGMLFGCSSFTGTQPDPYAEAFSLLRARHLAPPHRRIGRAAPEVHAYAEGLCSAAPDIKTAQQVMPPLLRTYLIMGGWVSDHAVVDRQMDTLHVFTGLEIAAIPEARKRLLRATAEGIDGPAVAL